MFGSAFTRGKSTRAFNHQINPQFFPRKLFRFAVLHQLVFFSVDGDLAFFALHVHGERAVVRVVLQQMRRLFGVAQIINCNDIDFRIHQVGPKNHAAASAKSIDGNSHSGRKLVFRKIVPSIRHSKNCTSFSFMRLAMFPPSGFPPVQFTVAEQD